MSTHPEIHLILDMGVEIPGEILNISHVGIHLRVPVRFVDGAVLGFRVHNCTAKGQVLYCRPDGDQFFVALSANGDRRSEPRFAVNQPVTISIVSEDPRRKNSHARLVDVSESGIGVTSDCPFDVGSLVEVCAEGSVLYGEVRNCSKVPSGLYRLGILAEETFAQDLREEHLSAWKQTLKTCTSRVHASFAGRLGKRAGPKLGPQAPGPATLGGSA
jgi:hypothetical protein